jgi:hypothetical protein
MFGDGGTSGANAGLAVCGSTARADHTSPYTHAHARPGTFQFSDQVTVQPQPPSCALAHNCPPHGDRRPVSVRCDAQRCVSVPDQEHRLLHQSGSASFFSPPRLVTMDASGSFQTCSGSQCSLGNPATETPVLAYGSATAGGPFQCLSRPQGMLCIVVGHRLRTLSIGGTGDRLRSREATGRHMGTNPASAATGSCGQIIQSRAGDKQTPRTFDADPIFARRLRVMRRRLGGRSFRCPWIPVG